MDAARGVVFRVEEELELASAVALEAADTLGEAALPAVESRTPSLGVPPLEIPSRTARSPAAAAGSSKAGFGCGVAAGGGCGGTGIGREALAGANTDRRARSAAEMRLSKGLSDCMHSL